MKSCLPQIQVRPIALSEEPRWASLLEQHHYLGYARLIGERISYVAESIADGEWVAVLSWASAALKTSDRDSWIGWCAEHRTARLHLVANNWRFLILPSFRIRNLASRVLSLNLKRLSSDWLLKYGHPILLVETFVDSKRNTGACYKANNWIKVGLTKGFRRIQEEYDFHGDQKFIFVKPLAAEAKSLLGGGWTSSQVVIPYPRRRGMFDPNKLEVFGPKGLLKFCSGIKDSRSKHGKRFQTTPMLTFCLLAIMSGMHSYGKISIWGKTLTTKQLADLKLWRAPSLSAIRSFILSLNAAEVDEKITQWLMASDSLNGQAIALDGKTLRGSHDGDKKPIQLLSLVLHGEGLVVAQEIVESKTNEIPMAQKLLSKLNIEGAIITGDALHTQTETATIIARDKNADYVFVAKDNQPTLKAEIQKALTESAFSP